nr:leaf rust 10 disease-resistance locus receptor-like protein kinase-like 1.3 [Quercus suber]
MFNCGKLNNIGFPFWGDNRPNSCGYPGLKLNCQGSVATIKIMNVTYQVLGVNPDAQILNITREDFSAGICSPEFVNSTLDPTLLDFGVGLQNLTIVYGCFHLIPFPGQFDCQINGFAHITWGADGPGECRVSVVVPVLVKFGPWTGIEIDQSKLEEAIGEGFDVKWKVDTAACLNCTVKKGVCGYDLKRNQSTCYYSSPGSSWWNQSFKGVAAGIVGTIAIVFVMIICYLKREQLSSNVHSIEIPPKPFLFSPARSVQYSSTTSLP